MSPQIISTANGRIVVREGNIKISEENKVTVVNIPKRERCQMDLENSGSIKIIVGKNAHLEMNEIYREAVKNIDLKVVCERDAVVKRKVSNLCSSGSFKMECNLNEEGAEFVSKEIHFGSCDTCVDNTMDVIHKASNTKSVIEVKEALKESSKSFTRGKVIIEKCTKNVNTFLSAHALLLDENTRVKTIPALEIESADVQAGHAASVSTIDPDQVFYLTSRGLSSDAAKKEIVKGFLSDLGEGEEINKLVEEQWQTNLMLTK